EGAPAEIVREYAGNEVIEVERTEKTATLLDKLGVAYDVAGDMLQVFTDRADDIVGELLDLCRHEAAITVRPATLEDVFLRLTGRSLRE
ncbi:MAG TPA: ABC transporter ATP-binding protein, partial [Methanoculleus sp.]|nr:ABC transporter ATP-binding protein [Methanoculleus sp.]